MKRRTVIAIGVGCTWAGVVALLGGCPSTGRVSGDAATSAETGVTGIPFATGPGNTCQDAAATADQPCYLNDPWDGGASRGHFFHLSEGSELFPYAWLLALKTDAGATFFDPSAPPYGLLHDPKDPSCADDTCNRYGQPVGMTVAKTRDLSWLGLEMFGFNCAACHVGELTEQGKTFRVVGGPNMFDIIGFLTAFKASIAYTVGSLDASLAFVARVAENALTANQDPTLDRRLQVAKSITSVSKLDSNSPAARALTPAVQKAFADFKAHHPKKAPLAHVGSSKQGVRSRWMPVESDAEKPIAPHVAALTDRLARMPKVAVLPPVDAGSPPGALAQPELAVSDAVNYLSDFGEVLALLLQRLDDIERILNGAGGGAAITAPGPGRVDAFMMAHNSLFPTEPTAPMTSPVDYPRIWNLSEVRWFHWDSNTDSLLERNVGQALGLGALVDPANGQSTVPIADMQELETLAREIPRPVWPFPIDAALATRGAAVFKEQHCQDCHASDGGGGVVPVDVIGTDPLRQQSFAMNMAKDGSFDGEPFVYALATELNRIVTQAILANDASASWDVDASWRLTGGYPERPLDGIWASAPYLHNGSVATMDDLLTPPGQRPASYMAGSRAYDTARIGYQGNGPFPFDAGAPGNAATGHAYGVDASADDKAALKEYLKTL